MSRQSKASALATGKAQKVAFIMEHKTRGYSFAEIGDLLGCTKQNVSTIYWDERRKLQDRSAAASEVLDAEREDSYTRCMSIIRAWLPFANGTEKDEQGLAVLDKDAAAIVLKYEERVSKLKGLDAPTRSDVTSNGQTISAIGADLTGYTDEELAALEAIHRRVQDRLEGPVIEQ